MKTVELCFTECAFRSKCHYRLLLDADGISGGVTTEWSDRTQTPKFKDVVLSEFDNQKRVPVVVEAMVKGEAKEIASGVIEGDARAEEVEGECILSIGTIKFSMKRIFLPVFELFGNANHNKSVMGLSLACAIPGDHHEGVTKQFQELKVKIFDNENHTVLGKGKLGARRSTLFIQLSLEQVDLYRQGALSLGVDSTSDSNVDIKIPCIADTFNTSISVKDENGESIILMISAHLTGDSLLCGGLINTVDIFSNKEDGFNQAERIKFNSTQIVYMNIVDPTCEVTDGDLSSENATKILARCFEFPLSDEESKNSKDLQVNGTFCFVPKVHSKDKKSSEITAKALQAHRSTLSLADDKRKNEICMEVMTLDITWELTDSNSVKILEKKIDRYGTLKEVKRQNNGNDGNSIVLEGELKANVSATDSTALFARSIFSTFSSSQPEKSNPIFESDSDEEKSELSKSSKNTSKQPLKEASSSANISVKDTPLEIDSLAKDDKVPYGHSEGVRENSLPELKAAMELSPRAVSKGPIQKENQPGEMPGLSTLEDIAHEGSLNALYESFGTLLEESDVVDNDIGGNLSPKAILSHKRATKAGTALAQVIKAELVEKQRIINRLLNEATARSDAIDLCGDEIRGLRKEVNEWKDTANEAKLEITKTENNIATASKFVENTVGSPEELSSLNRATLIHIALDLGNRLKKSDEERIKMKKIVMEGQSARNMYLESQQHLSDLTEAHLHQSHFIQKLQKKIGKMDNYKSTIKLQESIIGKMQKVVEAHLKLSRREGTSNQNELLDKLILEIETSEKQTNEEKSSADAIRKNEMALKIKEQELAKAKREIEMLDKENKTLRDSNNEASKNNQLIDDDRLFLLEKENVEELQVEVTTQGYRIVALEEQLEISAQEHAREIARLRTKLFDLEMAAMLSENDDNPVSTTDNAEAVASKSSSSEVLNNVASTSSIADKTGTAECFEHDEVILPIQLKNDKEFIGMCDVSFKIRYSTSIDGPLEAESEVELVITKLLLKEYHLDPEQGMNKVFLDLSFIDDWTFKSDPVDASGTPLEWDNKNNRKAMTFKTTFAKASTENMLVVAMIHAGDPPNKFFGSGHEKLISIEEAKASFEEHKEELKYYDATEKNPEENKDGNENALDDLTNSPRPVPTGKLHRNMAVLNAALRVVGKIAANTDVDEEEDNARSTRISQNVQVEEEANILPDGIEI